MSDKNIYGLTNLSNKAVVEVIRNNFLLEANTNPHLYDPIDVERCRTEDWQIERFLLEKGAENEALKALIKAMKWKKCFGVHERDHKYFPKELPQIFGHEKASRDREGRLCSWSTSHLYTRLPDFDQIINQYFAFRFEAMDRIAANVGIVSIIDAREFGFSRGDLAMAKFSTDMMEYYPQVMKIGCTIDLPWLLLWLARLAKSFMSKSNRDKIVLIKREEFTDYIDIDINELPVSIGGNREPVYDLIDDMLSLRQCKHLSFTDKQINSFYEVYKFD